MISDLYVHRAIKEIYPSAIVNDTSTVDNFFIGDDEYAIYVTALSEYKDSMGIVNLSKRTPICSFETPSIPGDWDLDRALVKDIYECKNIDDLMEWVVDFFNIDTSSSDAYYADYRVPIIKK